MLAYESSGRIERRGIATAASTHMTSDLLLDTRRLKVVVGDGEVSPHLGQSLGRDNLNAQLVLGLGKAQPEAAPDGVPGPLAEELRHLGAAVAAGQGRLVDIVGALQGALQLELLNLLLQLEDLGLGVGDLLGHLGRLSVRAFLCYQGVVEVREF